MPLRSLVPLALAALVPLAGCTSAPGDAGPRVCAPTAAPSAGTFRFAVFGDVRPPNSGDTTAYPKTVIASLFRQIAAQSPDLVVGTGDYMFASTSDAAGIDAQLAMLRDAEKAYAGPIYHALGNHECTGATASNCPRGDETANMRAFMQQLLPPDTTTPYFRVDVDTGRGAAKLVFVAANAWSDAQAAWLEAQLADPTAYTFVIRHEPPSVPQTAGVAASETIIHRHPLTLELLGHFHRYQRIDGKHIISGNAGAPLSSGARYGFVLVDLMANGNLAVSEIDESTGDASDTFTVCPD